MTVTSTNYSSLDEVWGESFNPSQKSKKEKKKKIHDPICELYEMGNNNGYNDNDIVNYANNYFERYDKTPFQRTMNDHVATQQSFAHTEREKPTREVVVTATRSDYDVSDTDDVAHHAKPTTAKKEPFQQPIQYFSKGSKGRYNDDDEEESDLSSPSGFAFIDLLLYIISGIILIFVMEQFVKIGLLLQ